MKSILLTILAIFAMTFLVSESKAQYIGNYGYGTYSHTYSTGIVAPGFQLQLGPVVTVRRPSIQYRYFPHNDYRRPLGSVYGPLNGPVAPYGGYNNGGFRYNGPNVNIYVR